MKKRKLFVPVFQISVGIAAIAAYAVLAVSGEPLGKWTVSLLLGITFLIIGIIGIIAEVKDKK